ncbi:hypothetical protein ABZX85_41360 [Streptomyces sp. NPDC004539]|uniref:hypothetical protein n=1 Tax=Streptomyces sp. NPDC004539 TaxID=3154280 RepID=UPI0033ACF6D2
MHHRANDPVSDGPLDTAPFGYLPHAAQRDVLLAELDRAGVELGAYDRLIVDWIAGWDYPTVATIASLIRRAGHTPQ